MSVRYKASAVWRNVVKGYNKVAGSWAKTDVVYLKENGSWRVVAKRVPNVTGQAYDTAQATLVARGFTVNKSNTNSTDSTYNGYSGGYVASQVPGIDELADMGSTITLNTITYQVNAPSFGPYFAGPYFGAPPPVVPGPGPVAPSPVAPDPGPVAPDPGPVAPDPGPVAPAPVVPTPSFYPGFYVPYGVGLIGYAYVSPPSPYYAPSFSPAPPSFGFYIPGPSFGQFFGGGYYGGYCVFGDTKIHTTKGLVKASDINTGDNLLSIDVEEIDLNEEKANVYYWLSSTFTIKELTTTAVTRIRKVQVTDLVVINGESFSFDHLILVERDSEYEFVKAQFVKETDKILVFKSISGPIIEFTQVDNIFREHYREGVTVYEIGMEPYDVYFTERTLSHNK